MRALNRSRRARRAARAVVAVLLLTGVVAAFGPVGPAAARPRRADLAITGMVAGPAKVLAGEVVGIGVDVANLGTATSDTVAVDVTLPPALQVLHPGILGPEWACGFPTPVLRCTRVALAPGEVAGTLQINATVIGGSPGDLLTVTAVVSTTSRELSTANNAGQASVTLVTAGTVRGTVWIDGNRDGHRGPDETTVSALENIRIQSEDGNQIFDIPVYIDGTYSLTLKPDRYFVEVTVSPAQYGFTTPNIGDEATDSDVTLVSSDEFSATARSEVFEVTGGSETVIDIGLVEANPL